MGGWWRLLAPSVPFHAQASPPVHGVPNLAAVTLPIRVWRTLAMVLMWKLPSMVRLHLIAINLNGSLYVSGAHTTLKFLLVTERFWRRLRQSGLRGARWRRERLRWPLLKYAYTPPVFV